MKKLKAIANDKFDDIYDSIHQYNKPKIEDYINIDIVVNKDNYYGKNEYKKKYE